MSSLRIRLDAIPEVLPDRDELVRAEAAAPTRVEACTRVLGALMATVHAGLPSDAAERFIDGIRRLPRALDALACWDLFYGRAHLDVPRVARTARALGLGDAELALVGVLDGLARWCDEASLRRAVEGLARPETWRAGAKVL